MYAVSEKFRAAMEFRPYKARITLDGVDVIGADAVEEINFTGGANDSDEAVSLGSAVAGSVELTLQKELVSAAIAGRKMFIELGIDLDGEMEWVPMGTYFAGDVTEDDGMLTVPGLDAMAAKFEKEYEPLTGVNFSQEGGVSSHVFLLAICDKFGVEVDVNGLEAVALTAEPTGYTWRRCIGMIAALSGKFAYMDRYGVLRFRWYTGADIAITADNYYAGGMEKASYGFTVGWIKCYVESLAETICQGDETKDQGIYLECPWMTEERLAAIWAQIGGFAYRPVPNLSFLGDPRLEPGDIITMEDTAGDSVTVPIMGIRHEYDGGLLTELSAQGSQKTESYEGPISRQNTQTKKAVAKIEKTVKGIEMSVTDMEERFSTFEQTAGQVKVEVGASGGVLSTNITAATEEEPAKWEAYYKDADGNVLSGFYFDFEKGQFMFDGAGKFTGQINVNDMFLVDELGNLTSLGNAIMQGGKFYAQGGNSGWMEMDSDGYVMYSRSGNQVVKIGFPESQTDYPYIWLGAAVSDSGESGMVKRFSDGLWMGNSAPVAESGNFVAKEGYNGIFISFEESKTYVVKDTTMTSLYTGEAIARFG